MEEIKKPYGIIYCITNKINNNVYIGKTTKSLEVRSNGHITYAYKRNNTSYSNLYKAMRLYGIDCFEFKGIDVADNLNSLNRLEIMYIKKYRMELGINNVYNMTNGGDGGAIRSGYKNKQAQNDKQRTLMIGKFKGYRAIHNVNTGQTKKVHKNDLDMFLKTGWKLGNHDNLKRKGANANNSKFFNILTEEFLINEYIINKKSSKTIALSIGCNYHCVNTYLKKFHIPANNYKTGKTLKNNYCIDCNNKILSGSTRCSKCALQVRKGKTLEDMYGVDRALTIKNMNRQKHTGIKFSEEHKKKIGISHKNRKNNVK